jgi:hypothetical protein
MVIPIWNCKTWHFTKLLKHTYTRPEEADVTSLLNSICNFDFVVTIAIVQMCLAFKKGLILIILYMYLYFHQNGNSCMFCLFFNFLVKINDIQKRISLKEPQVTSVGGYTYMVIPIWNCKTCLSSAPLPSNKSSTYINIRFSGLVNVTICLLIEWFRSVWWK